MLLLLALDAEEPSLLLLPVDVVVLFVLLAVILAPVTSAVAYLIGIGRENKHVAVAWFYIHIREVEGGTLFLAEGTIDFGGGCNRP